MKKFVFSLYVCESYVIPSPLRWYDMKSALSIYSTFDEMHREKRKGAGAN